MEISPGISFWEKEEHQAEGEEISYNSNNVWDHFTGLGWSPDYDGPIVGETTP